MPLTVRTGSDRAERTEAPLLAGRPAQMPALARANGTWFVWVVGTQSIAVAAASLTKPLPDALAALATCCWASGVVPYLITALLVATALLTYPVRPADLTPLYWARAWPRSCSPLWRPGRRRALADEALALARAAGEPKVLAEVLDAGCMPCGIRPQRRTGWRPRRRSSTWPAPLATAPRSGGACSGDSSP